MWESKNSSLTSRSLRDELAADSLDLVDLALAFEGEFAIVVPERIWTRFVLR